MTQPANQTITYEAVAWMQPVKSRDGKSYYTLGRVTNQGLNNTLAVTPVDGNGETMFFCLEHEEAYFPRWFCEGCRMQPREHPTE